MIELITLVYLVRSNRRTVEEKGIPATKYVMYTILLWFGFEALFWILGIVFFRVPLMAYLFALIGAAVGGYISYQISRKARPEFNDFEELE